MSKVCKVQSQASFHALLACVGTDILLGGNADYMARLKLREMLMPEIVSQGVLVVDWETANLSSLQQCPCGTNYNDLLPCSQWT